MRFFGLARGNRITTQENTANDQLNLKNAINNFKKSMRPKPLEKIDEKELMPLIFSRDNIGLLMALRLGYFQMKTSYVVDDDDNDYLYAYDNELHLKGPQTRRTPSFPQLILEPPAAGRST